MAGLRFYPTLSDVPFVYDASGNPTRTGTIGDLNTANVQSFTRFSTTTNGMQGLNAVTVAGDTEGSTRTAVATGVNIVVGDVVRANTGLITLNISTNTPSSTNRLRTTAFGAADNTAFTVFINNIMFTGVVDQVGGTTGNQTHLIMDADTRAMLSQVSTGDTIHFEGLDETNSITGFGPTWNFSNLRNTGMAPYAILPGSTWRVNVIDQAYLELSAKASFDVEVDGAHLAIMNSTVTIDDWQRTLTPDDTNDGGRSFWFTRELDNTEEGFSSGLSPLGRPRAFTLENFNTAQTNRSFNFYGCDIIVGDRSLTTNTDDRVRDFRMVIADCRDTVFRYLDTSTANQRLIYPKPGAVWQNVSLQTHPFTTTEFADRSTVFLQGPGTFIDVDFRGFALSVVDTARVKLFAPTVAPTGLIAGFNAGNDDDGNSLQNSGRGFLKVVNPNRVIAQAGSTSGDLQFTSNISANSNAGLTQTATNELWRQSQRYIEIQQWIADYNETLTTKADGINIVGTFSHTFAAANDYISLTETPHIATYATDANGGTSGTIYLPDEGQEAAAINSDGLQIPVRAYGTDSNTNQTQLVDDVTQMTGMLEVRSFYHDILETYNINKTSLDLRVLNDSQRGTAQTVSTLAAIDPNIRTNTLYVDNTASPLVKRSQVQIAVELNNFFSTTTMATPQEIYEYLKFFWGFPEGNGYLTNLNRPTVTSGAVNWQGTVRFGSAVSYSNPNNELTLIGTGLGSTIGDPVTGLNIDGLLDLNNLSANVNIDVHQDDTTVTLTIDNPRTFEDARTLVPTERSFGGTVQRATTTISVPAGETQYVRFSQTSGHQMTIVNSGLGRLVISGPVEGDLLANQMTAQDGTISSGGIIIAAIGGGLIEFEPAPAFTHTISLAGFSPAITSGFQIKLYEQLTTDTILTGTSRQTNFNDIILSSTTTPGLTTGFNFTIGFAAHGIPVQFIPVEVTGDNETTVVSFDNTELNPVNIAREGIVDFGTFTRSFNVSQTSTGDATGNGATPTITLTGFDADQFTTEALNIGRITQLRQFEDFLDALRTRAGTLAVADGRVNGDIMRVESNQELILHPDVRLLKGTNVGQQHMRGILRGQIVNGAIARLTGNNALLLRTREVANTRDVFNPGERTINIIQGELTQADLDAARNAIIGNIYGAS